MWGKDISVVWLYHSMNILIAFRFVGICIAYVNLWTFLVWNSEHEMAPWYINPIFFIFSWAISGLYPLEFNLFLYELWELSLPLVTLIWYLWTLMGFDYVTSNYELINHLHSVNLISFVVWTIQIFLKLDLGNVVPLGKHRTLLITFVCIWFYCYFSASCLFICRFSFI